MLDVGCCLTKFRAQVNTLELGLRPEQLDWLLPAGMMKTKWGSYAVIVGRMDVDICWTVGL